MKKDADERKDIVPNSIVQISDHNEKELIGSLLIVETVESWGVKGYRRERTRLIGDNTTSIETVNDQLSWSHIEFTGGKVVFDRAGVRVVDEPVMKHHP